MLKNVRFFLLLAVFCLADQLCYSRVQAANPLSIGTLYDIDAVSESGRPDGPGGSWWFLNPNAPNLPPSSGIYRHSTPITGLYEAKDPGIIRQHAYWLASAGLDHIQVDWTNLRAKNDPGNTGSFFQWTEGVKAATANLLQTYSEITDFPVPKVKVAIRMQDQTSDSNFYTTQLANEVDALYQQYPGQFFQFPDSTPQQTLPTLDVFFDTSDLTWGQGPQWTDGRFNTKYTNGYLPLFGNTYMEPEGYIKDNLPYQLFVENDKLPNGDYRDFWKRQSPTERQQMVAWAGVYHGGLEWDEWGEVWNGKTTFEHQLDNVIANPPRVLAINRFNNYASWFDSPAEGLTETKSASFEPTTTMGFEKIYEVTDASYGLKGLPKNPPQQPTVEILSVNGVTAKISFFTSLSDLKNLDYPQEYAVSVNPGQTGSFNYIDVNSPNFDVTLNGQETLYLTLRNAFGQSTQLSVTGLVSTIRPADIAVYRPSSGDWLGSHNIGSPQYLNGTTTTQVGPSGSTSTKPLIGDVNGDGLDDIVRVDPAGNFNWTAGHTTDSNNDGAGELAGGLGNSTLVGFGTVAGSEGNFLADINGDEFDDAVTVNAGFNWYSNSSSSAGLGAGPTSGPVQFGLAGDQPITGDFDGDGFEDIGVYRVAGGNIFWKSSAGGVLGAGVQGPIGQIGGFAGQDSLLVGDLNGDGFDDAVMVRQDGAGLMEWWGLINDGTGFLDFFNPGTTMVSFGQDNGSGTPVLADINGDGFVDIGAIQDSGGQLTWNFAFSTSSGLSNLVATSAIFGSTGDIPLIGQFNILSADADFDMDDDIDGKDFLSWQRGYGLNSGATFAQGDADADGDVDSVDLLFFENQFGNPTSLIAAGAEAVPEPASYLLMLLGFGVTVCLFYRRK